MREPDVEGVAIHDGPASCGGAGNGVVEAFDRGMHEVPVHGAHYAAASRDGVLRPRSVSVRMLFDGVVGSIIEGVPIPVPASS